MCGRGLPGSSTHTDRPSMYRSGSFCKLSNWRWMTCVHVGRILVDPVLMPGSAVQRVQRSNSLSISSRRNPNPFPVIVCDPVDASAPQKEKNLQLYGDLVARQQQVLSATTVSKKVGGAAKLGVRERLALLADAGSEVLEIGLLAGLGLPYGDIPCGGNVVCVLEVSGEKCVISANDWTVKGGCSYPITLKKQLRAQEIALQNRLPCIYLVDSGGAFLPLQSELYPDKEHGGRVFRNEAVLSSHCIPQIAVVTGPCTAGGAYVPTMCDEVVIVEKSGSLYLGGPPLVRVATGEVLTSEELGGARVHCRISGCTDHFAASEEAAFEMTRGIIASLNLPVNMTGRKNIQPPAYDSSDEEFASLIPDTLQKKWPMLDLIARLVDGSRLQQFKGTFGTNLITGFARLAGYLVGVVANQGDLDEHSSLKGAHFVRLCSLRGIPLLFLVNTPSDSDFLSAHGSPGKVAKARAQMMATVATSSVPKITVVCGGSYGPSAYAMCGRAMQPRFMFCWPHARMGVACSRHLLDAGVRESTSMEQLQQEEADYPTSALLHDGLILPSETRQVIAECLEISSKYSDINRQKQTSLSVLRM